jgi:hypothetical protein
MDESAKPKKTFMKSGFIADRATPIATTNKILAGDGLLVLTPVESNLAVILMHSDK